jgi:hypothetical protein
MVVVAEVEGAERDFVASEMAVAAVIAGSAFARLLRVAIASAAGWLLAWAAARLALAGDQAGRRPNFR